MKSSRIYFDNAATTPLDKNVQEVMIKSIRENFGNPSSIHFEGRKAKSAVEKARRIIAKSLNASIGDIFFTSGGTESNNMALKCAVRDLNVKRIITSKTEHHCVWHTVEFLHKSHNTIVEYVDVDSLGRVQVDHLEELLQKEKGKTMVSLMHSNNEIGTMIDLDEISRICDKYNALFHSDTVQTIGYFPIDVSKTKINFLAGSSHKFYGPKGVGFIYINSDNIIKPFIHGGSQERNMRGSTENTIGIAGMAKAIELAYKNLEKNKKHILKIREYLKKKLLKEFSGITFNGDIAGKNHYKVLSVSFPKTEKSDMLMMNLDIEGISASGGSACSSGVEGGSHVLEAINANPDRKSVRFSFSHHNTIEEVDILIQILQKII